MLNSYNFGSVIRFSVAFTDQTTGDPADPTDVKLRVQIFPNTYAEFTYLLAQVVRDGLGAYHCDYAPPYVGNGQYAWEGVGALEAATPNIPIQVQDNLFTD